MNREGYRPGELRHVADPFREPAPPGGEIHYADPRGAVQAGRPASLSEVVDKVVAYAQDVGVETAILARLIGFSHPDMNVNAKPKPGGEQIAAGQTARLVEVAHLLAASLTVMRQIKERL